MSCNICKSKTKKKKILTRSNKKLYVHICSKCDYEFFTHDPYQKLKKNKLDISRLKKAGLKIQTISDQFKNGQTQSKKYIKQYINKFDKRKKILEIGCSYGYFLYELKKYGCKPYGVELNNTQIHFIRKKLKIRCEESIEKYLSENIIFDKIFLFYSLEYIPNPKKYIINLYRLLRKGGEIVIITPNKNDILKDLIDNQNYKNFFYDENSINYFSIKSLKKILNFIKIKKFNIKSAQEYSLINLFNWHINGKPMKSNFVGEDKYFEEFLQKIKITKKNKTLMKIEKEILKIFLNLKKDYKKVLQKYNFGNQILLKIKK